MKPRCVFTLVVVFVFSASASVRADQLTIDNLTYPQVQVIGLHGSGLTYVSPTGATQSVPLSKVQSIRIERFPSFHQAHQAFISGKYDQAVDLLKKVRSKVDEPALERLVSLRLSQALDLGGRFRDALRAYLPVVREVPSPLVLAYAPRNLPQDAEARRAARQTLRQALSSISDITARRQLRELMQRLQTDPSDSKSGGRGSQGGMRTSIRSTPVTQALENGRYQHALKLIEQRLGKPADSREMSVSGLLYQRGLAQAGLGAQREAALSFMRVIIHFNRSGYALPALIHAGGIFKSLGKPEHAHDLWRQALNRAESPRTSRRIKNRMQSLKGEASAP